MIRELSGDLLLSDAPVLVHGVAPNDDFHTGLALAVRERWPALYKDFKHYCHSEHPKPGSLWTWGGPGGLRVVQLFTQDAKPNHGGHPGKAHIENVNHALRELHKLIEKEGWTHVALPKLATGVGSLDWNDVYPLIKERLGHMPGVTVDVYTTFHAGVKA